MGSRYVTIWLRHLKTDWFARRKPVLKDVPFVLSMPQRGKMIVSAANRLAAANGISCGMAVADARAMVKGLQVMDDIANVEAKLLQHMGEWLIRYTPFVAVDLPDGLVIDATGCAHLWGGEAKYLNDIIGKLHRLGYDAHAAISGTIGCSWAMSRTSKGITIIEPGNEMEAIMPLPVWALRFDAASVERLNKLGLRQVKDFIAMPRQALHKRFGNGFLQRLDQSLGYEPATVLPLQPVEPYQERLPCLEPITTLKGIEIALERLLETVCQRLIKEQKGLRIAIFKGFRADGKIESIEVSTNHATNSAKHLFKLFALKFQQFEPATGVEVFLLEAQKVEAVMPIQESLWQVTRGLTDKGLAELLDRLETKFGQGHVQRFLPDEHHWPERSIKQAVSLKEQPTTNWPTDRPRPIQLLPVPEAIEVSAPVPDYPPMNFRHSGLLHNIKKADGPERIEQEWWIEEGEHRDYYHVEDENGKRYWLFRSGHYDANRKPGWFLHGYFA
jgi:protein ImuB